MVAGRSEAGKDEGASLKCYYFFAARPVRWGFWPRMGHGLLAGPLLLNIDGQDIQEKNPRPKGSHRHSPLNFGDF